MALQSYDGGFYWVHSDHLGSGRKLTDSTGAVVYRGEFDPHGQVVLETASGGMTYLNSHKFTGYEREWATNLNYAKARTYSHTRARFLQPDPLGLAAADLTSPQSLNRYSYVMNDPVNMTDPSGLQMQPNQQKPPDEPIDVGLIDEVTIRASDNNGGFPDESWWGWLYNPYKSPDARYRPYVPIRESHLRKALDFGQGLLGVAGWFPGFGAAPDGINAAIYWMRGDNTGMRDSLMATLPVLEWFAGAAKIARLG